MDYKGFLKVLGFGFGFYCLYLFVDGVVLGHTDSLVELLSLILFLLVLGAGTWKFIQALREDLQKVRTEVEGITNEVRAIVEKASEQASKNLAEVRQTVSDVQGTLGMVILILNILFARNARR